MSDVDKLFLRLSRQLTDARMTLGELESEDIGDTPFLDGAHLQVRLFADAFEQMCYAQRSLDQRGRAEERAALREAA